MDWLKRVLTVSNKIILLQIISILLLYIGSINWGAVVPNIPYDAGNYTAYNLISLSQFFLLVINILLLSGIFSMKQIGEPVESNPATESAIIALSAVSIIYFLSLWSMNLFLFVIPLYLFILILVFSFLSLFFSLKKKRRSTQSSYDEKNTPEFVIKLSRKLAKINHIYALIFFLIVWSVSFFTPTLNNLFFHISADKITILNYISITLGLLGIVLINISGHFTIKRLDEMQRLIQLEKANTFYRIFYALFLAVIIISINFHIKIDLFDLLMPVFFIMTVSSLAVDAKYK